MVRAVSLEVISYTRSLWGARPRLEEEVVQEVENEVARVEYVVAGPGLSVRVRDRVAGPTHDEVVSVAVVLLVLKGLVLWIVISWSLIEQGVDRRCNKLDVPDLLRGDRRHKLVKAAELLFGLHRDRLMEVVVEGGHLAKATTEQFLHGSGSIGVILS